MRSILLPLLVALPTLSAHALEPDRLRIGVAISVRDCMEGDEAACRRAADHIGDEGWAAFLRGRDGSTLTGEARSTWDLLACADGQGSACATAADGLDASTGGPLRATMLHLRACALDHAPSCSQLGIPSLHDLDAAQRLLRGDGDWTSPGAQAGAAVDAGEVLARAQQCDAGAPTDCLRLAGVLGQTLGNPVGTREVQQSLDAACTRGSASACALARDASNPDEPALAHAAASARLLERTCSMGTVERACDLAASLHDLGVATPWGTSRARSLWQSACDGGATRGCAHITSAYLTPLAATLDARCLAPDGPPHDCMEVSVMRTFGVGLPKDETLAAEAKVRACEARDPVACTLLGNVSWSESDHLAAFDGYRQGCEGGDGVSCGVVGRMMLNGEHGVPTDTSAGLARLRDGCRLGAGNACFELGFAYSKGKGMSADPSEAADRYLQACALGHINGCSSLGVLYGDGRGVSTDGTRALALEAYVCRRDMASACRNLGATYQDGLGGVAVDEARARWALRRGCVLGKDDACTRLTQLGNGPVTEPPELALPDLRPGYAATDWSDPAERPTTDVPGETPSPKKKRRARRDEGGDEALPGFYAGAGAGTQRSWSTATQASSLRLGLGYSWRYVGLSADLDLVSDARLRPKVARTYRRTSGLVALWARIPTKSFVDIRLGGGGVLGGYRSGPGKTQDSVVSYGAVEMLQIDFRFKFLTLGIRLEQQQLFQNAPGLDLDHVTGIHGFLGFGRG